MASYPTPLGFIAFLSFFFFSRFPFLRTLVEFSIGNPARCFFKWLSLLKSLLMFSFEARAKTMTDNRLTVITVVVSVTCLPLFFHYGKRKNQFFFFPLETGARCAAHRLISTDCFPFFASSEEQKVKEENAKKKKRPFLSRTPKLFFHVSLSLASECSPPFSLFSFFSPSSCSASTPFVDKLATW